LFLKIVLHIREFDDYFLCKKDCTGTIEFSSIQMCISALRILAYGALADTKDKGRLAMHGRVY